HRPTRDRARGALDRRRRRRARRRDHAGVLPPSRGRADPRRRARHPVPARQARAPPRARPRPHPRRGRPGARPGAEPGRLGPMSTREFRLPDLGEGLTESDIVEWKVAEGDVVELNQIIADVETAKALVELPAPVAGRVVALHATPGETV